MSYGFMAEGETTTVHCHPGYRVDGTGLPTIDITCIRDTATGDLKWDNDDVKCTGNYYSINISFI